MIYNPYPIPGYRYQSDVFLQDHFIGGATTSGAIGELGWSSAGTITRPSSTTNHPGQVRCSTGGSSGTQSRINFAQNSIVFDPSNPIDMFFLTKPVEIDANTLIRIGMSQGVEQNPTTNGIYFEKLDADTNWFIVTRAASVQTGTRIDTGVALSAADFIKFGILRLSTGVVFTMNGLQVGPLITANIPTQFLCPMVSILNSAAAAKTIDTDYFQIFGTGLVL